MFESGLVVNPSGTVRPCCHFRNDENGYKYWEDGWQEHHRELGEIMANSDDFIPGCWECQHMVELGEEPMLEYYNNKYKDHKGLIHIELKINNTCNLSCVMCDAWNSSKWYQLVKENPQMPESLKQIYGPPPNQKWHKDIDEFIPYLYFCKVLKFTGGEPFLIPQVKKLIDYCIESELASVMDLEFITNGTQDLTPYIEKFKKFKSVDIQYSIDAIGERFNYIRQGAQWSDVENKILDFQKKTKGTNIHIMLAAAIQALNVNHLDELRDWAKQHGLYVDDQNYVSDPIFMSPEALHDPDLRKRLIFALENLDKIHGTDYRKFLDE
jgi:MoaA/NifB/PqqE/SkfB family radical SAM enzyme